MKSMTGYGKREVVWKGMNVGVEVRSINHRFCEIVSRLPKGIGGVEEELKQLVHRHCERGRIELTVMMNGTTGRPKTVVIDRAVASRYHHLLRDLKREFHLHGEIDVGLISGFRDIFLLLNLLSKNTKSKVFSSASPPEPFRIW